MFTSDFYCLCGDDNNNLLRDTFDISFSYSMKNTFYRNLNREGSIFSDKKYSVCLKGKGVLPDIDNNNLKFFSSCFFCKKNGRAFFCSFNKIKDRQEIFESKWVDVWQFGETDTDDEFVFPIVNVLLKKIENNDKAWHLELIEK